MNIFRSEYIKNISKVSVGVLIAQMLSILLSPIITRLYSPSEFGVFSLYISIVLVIEVCACLRYEMTIVLAEDDKKASNLLWLSTIIMTTISAVVAFIVFVVYVVCHMDFFHVDIWNNIYALLPISIFAISLVNIFTLWCTRKKYFSLVSFIQAGLVIVNNLLSILAGLFIEGKGTYLIYSQLISYLVVAFITGLIIVKKDKEIMQSVKREQLRSLFIEYKRMALYNTPASVVNIFSQRLPAYSFPKFYGLTSVGYYDLVYRILKLPSQIVGNAIRNVFFQKVSEEYKSTGSFASSLCSNVKTLTWLSIFPFFLIGALSPWIFPLIFGSEWSNSGWYVIALLPWLATSFIVVPISSAVSITAQDKSFFKLQLNCLLVRIIVVIVGGMIFKKPVYTVTCFSITGCVFQLLILRLIARSTGVKFRNLFGKSILLYFLASVLTCFLIFITVLKHQYVIAAILSFISILTYGYIFKNKFFHN